MVNWIVTRTDMQGASSEFAATEERFLVSIWCLFGVGFWRVRGGYERQGET